MSQLNWKKLEGFEAWSNELDALLQEARQASQQVKLAPRLSISDKLGEFIAMSRPNTPEILKLDQIAQQTAQDLLQTTIDNRLAGISARTSEYLRLVKEIDALAADNAANASVIRLEHIRSAIDSATQTINSVTQLREVLEQGTARDQKIAASIQQTVQAVQALRSQIAKLI